MHKGGLARAAEEPVCAQRHHIGFQLWGRGAVTRVLKQLVTKATLGKSKVPRGLVIIHNATTRVCFHRPHTEMIV